MQDCREKALSLFRKGLDMRVDNDPDTYHWIERQRMLILSQISKADKNIEEQTANFKERPHDLYSHINLLAAHLFANMVAMIIITLPVHGYTPVFAFRDVLHPQRYC